MYLNKKKRNTKPNFETNEFMIMVTIDKERTAAPLFTLNSSSPKKRHYMYVFSSF
jgi:hypothetical protein